MLFGIAGLAYAALQFALNVPSDLLLHDKLELLRADASLESQAAVLEEQVVIETREMDLRRYVHACEGRTQIERIQPFFAFAEDTEELPKNVAEMRVVNVFVCEDAQKRVEHVDHCVFDAVCVLLHSTCSLLFPRCFGDEMVEQHSNAAKMHTCHKTSAAGDKAT